MRAEALPRTDRHRPVAADGTSSDGLEPVTPAWPCQQEPARPARLPLNLAGLKVLVVDDDESSLDYFAMALTMCGAAVTAVVSAREALDALATAVPDVIVTDIAMPGEDGYWLLEEVRRHAETGVREVPVVAATAFGREHPRRQTLAAGFVDYLTKPIDPEALCRAIARAAGR